MSFCLYHRVGRGNSKCLRCVTNARPQHKGVCVVVEHGLEDVVSLTATTSLIFENVSLLLSIDAFPDQLVTMETVGQTKPGNCDDWVYPFISQH